MTVYYDQEADYLEVLFERKPGHFRETAHDAVMEKVDAEGRVIGFSILKASAARDAGAIVMSKDADFVRLLNQHGAPPQVVWLTAGNTSNARLRVLLRAALPEALALLRAGEPIVELRGR